ncbi:MAG: adenylate/guanylate cyclase domain-containing protein [Candidatus Binatia bacterium]
MSVKRRGGGAERTRTERAAPASAPAYVARLRACVLVTSLRNFESLGGHPEPRRVIALLQELISAVTDIAVAHRAAIDAVSGDGVRLVFGFPTPRRDDPVRALRTAAALQRVALALRNRWLSAGEGSVAALALSVGVAAGEVLIADLRSGGGSAGTPIGEPVRRAARLCAAARGGEILADEATYASAAARLEGELVFTARSLTGGRSGHPAAYRVQARRAGLLVVPRRGAGIAG